MWDCLCVRINVTLTSCTSCYQSLIISASGLWRLGSLSLQALSGPLMIYCKWSITWNFLALDFCFRMSTIMPLRLSGLFVFIFYYSYYRQHFTDTYWGSQQHGAIVWPINIHNVSWVILADMPWNNLLALCINIGAEFTLINFAHPTMNLSGFSWKLLKLLVISWVLVPFMIHWANCDYVRISFCLSISLLPPRSWGRTADIVHIVTLRCR